MSIGEYRGVDGVARKIAGEYRGVEGIAREVASAYRGVNGVARKYFDHIRNKWQFFIHTDPVPNYPNDHVTVYDWFSGWEDSAIVMRIDAQATNNDRAYALAEAHLCDDFLSGGTMKITLESSNDPSYVDKIIYFVSSAGEFSSNIVVNTSSGNYSFEYVIPTGTTKICFYIDHHSSMRSSEYFIIKNLVINGKTYV